MIQKRKTEQDLPTSLRGIAKRAKKDQKARFGNLYGLLNKNNLRECFYRLKRRAAPGVDGVTFEDYEGDLESNLDDLVSRLKAGILTENKDVIHPVTGTPQGGIVSPVLANIYLHYALDLWFEKKVRPATSGQAMIMRYANDFVCAFQYRDEAEAFMTSLTERLGKFNLELAEEKSGLVAFSRYRLKENGSFAFLGFRYHWTLSRNGKPKVQRMTDPKKRQASVRAFSEWIRANRHQRTTRLMVTLRRKLAGYWNYYGVTGNFPALGKYWWKVLGLLYKWLNRRSHKRSYKWKGFMACLKDFGVPAPRITEQSYGRPTEQQQWLVF